jgi:hypothetical protein
MKNEILFFEIVRVFGTPKNIDVNFDSIEFDPNNSLDALKNIKTNIENIAIYYQIKGVRICFTIAEDNFNYQINAKAKANIKTEIKILKRIKMIKNLQFLTRNFLYQSEPLTALAS